MLSSRLLNPSDKELEPEKQPDWEHRKVDIGIVGDLLLTNKITKQNPTFSYTDLKELLWKPLGESDIIIANLEGPITKHDQPYQDKPYNLNNSEKVVGCFDSRFCLSLANNHIMDYGAKGLMDTIEALNAGGIAYAGAGRTIAEAGSPRFLNTCGITVAVICAADPRFQPATKTTPGTFPAIADLLHESIHVAREQAHLVIISVHMGLEHVSVPSRLQIQLAEMCLRWGAKVVQFHHSHCIGGTHLTPNGLCLYGTGNYFFPKINKFEPRSARRTAAWRIRYAVHADSITQVSMRPASMDENGIPYPLVGRRVEVARQRMRRMEDRLKSPGARTIWRALEMLKPSFVALNVYNYLSIIRRQGFGSFWRSLADGVRTHWA